MENKTTVGAEGSFLFQVTEDFNNWLNIYLWFDGSALILVTS